MIKNSKYCKMSIKEKFVETYTPLVIDFMKNIENINAYSLP